LPYPLYNML